LKNNIIFLYTNNNLLDKFIPKQNKKIFTIKQKKKDSQYLKQYKIRES